ncbi:MAG: ATP-dependent DNA helicase [Treponemataceae bacterium]|nr:MAG: ATP-dependent DNA helicase [Treponemataceae bacterium]
MEKQEPSAAEFQQPEYYLSSAGPLAAKIPTFEERRGQIQLLKRIQETFELAGIGVFEAGTGVGKSFAYLVPAILWHIQQKERVVISTGTINLQQQLIEKDIPLALEILGAHAQSVKAVLVKGRQQYLCIRRFLDVRGDRTLFSDEEDEIEKIAAWFKATKDGSRSDLSFMPNESLWTRINSEADACMGARCMHREDCFVMRLKKEAAGAGIIVVNHHLLFADVEARSSAGAGFEEALVLPPYKRLIFDEAHGIEDAATSFFSASLNRFKIQKLLNAIFRARRGKTGGLLLALSVLAKSKENADAVPSYIEKVKLAIEKLDFEALEILKDLRSLRLTDRAGFNAPPTAPFFAHIFPCFAATQTALTDLVNVIQRLLDDIPEDDAENPVVYEIKQTVRRLIDASLFCKTFGEWTEYRSHVFWLEKGRFTPRDGESKAAVFYANFYQTPLEIAHKMNADVFEQMETVICTSATLCAGDAESKESFQFWLNRTGVNFSPKGRADCGVFASPFPYKENALVCITSDAPPPQESSAFQAYAENAITDFIEAAKGRTLVLFTSFDSLRSACRAARSALRASNYTVLCQGEDDRSRLLHIFRSDVSSVLFATDSFWQGIDVQGESLSQVIIVKLPFAVPSDPVFAARSEAIEEKGGSSFMELSVPDAVIKFRQGFGRLIRHSDDRGVIVILDKRIIEKRYGQIFLESIPKTKVFSGNKKDIAAQITDFLGSW